jgi:hypothetical protein
MIFDSKASVRLFIGCPFAAMLGTAVGVVVLSWLRLSTPLMFAILSGMLAVVAYVSFIIFVVEPREPGHGYSPPPPPFKASKRTATIMYGLWYGRLTPEQARQKASEWGFEESSITRMITDATAKPSFWWWQEQNSRPEKPA